MNHANAKPHQWTQARRIVERAARAAGYDRNTADDMAQEALYIISTRAWRTTCPATPEAAAGRMVHRCRRWGWQQLMADRPRGRNPDETARAVEMATMAIYRERAGNLTPADMAAQAEGWGSIQRAAAVRTVVAHSLLDAVMAAQGIGPTALVHEAGHTPSLYGAGQPKRPPRRGCRGLHTDTDPVPGSHDRAADAPPVMIARRIAGPGR